MGEVVAGDGKAMVVAELDSDAVVAAAVGADLAVMADDVGTTGEIGGEAATRDGRNAESCRSSCAG